jgi:hypothetical protein
MAVTAALLGSVAAPIIGSALGGLFSSGDEEREKQLQAKALANIEGLTPLQADQLKVALAKYQQTGELTPELEQVINQSQSEMKSISVDPALRQAQMSALNKLQMYGEGGLQPQDMAALATIKQQAESEAQAQNASNLQNMQQRGIAGGGAELAARLSASQGAANRISQQGLDIQGQAAQRALQAIMQGGQLGGQIRGQEFDEAAEIAQAQDTINRFNAANSQSVETRNVGSKNQAKQYNLDLEQRIANANTDIQNQQAVSDRDALQQAYGYQAQKAGMLSGAQDRAAQQAGQSAGRTQQTWAGMGQAVGTGLQGLAAADMYNKRTDAMATKQSNPTANTNVVYNVDEDPKKTKQAGSLT